jgi:hypothetical protein
VIDRKLIFLFWPKTNIWQENAAGYSASNEYSAQRSKHCKNVYLNQEQKCFLGWQLLDALNRARSYDWRKQRMGQDKTAQ